MADAEGKALGTYEYQIDKEKMLRNIILRIHHNEDTKKIIKDFNKYFNDVSLSTISDLEEKIIDEGIKKSVADDIPRIHEILVMEKK